MVGTLDEFERKMDETLKNNSDDNLSEEFCKLSKEEKKFFFAKYAKPETFFQVIEKLYDDDDDLYDEFIESYITKLQDFIMQLTFIVFLTRMFKDYINSDCDEKILNNYLRKFSKLNEYTQKEFFIYLGADSESIFEFEFKIANQFSKLPESAKKEICDNYEKKWSFDKLNQKFNSMLSLFWLKFKKQVKSNKIGMDVNNFQDFSFIVLLFGIGLIIIGISFGISLFNPIVLGVYLGFGGLFSAVGGFLLYKYSKEISFLNALNLNFISNKFILKQVKKYKKNSIEKTPNCEENIDLQIRT